MSKVTRKHLLKLTLLLFFLSSSSSVDSGLSISDLKKVSTSERTVFERILRRNGATPTVAPVVVASKDVLTSSDGLTIEDEAVVKSMTQFRGKSQKDGTIDVYW